MRIKEIPSNGELFPTIALPDEEISTPKFRLFITIIVTILISTLIFIDQVLGLWIGGFYWILLVLGILLSCLIIGLLLEINDKRRKGAEETWLEKYGGEIGWLWWKLWQIVTTPLAQQPELMIPVKSRLVRRKTVEA